MLETILGILPYVVICLLFAGCIALLIAITELQRNLLFIRTDLNLVEKRLDVERCISKARHETILNLTQQIDELLKK